MGEIGSYKGDAVLGAIRKARRVGPSLQAFAESVAKWKGARITPINYKSYASAKRKAAGEKHGISDVKDLTRTTVIASRKDIPEIVKRIEKGNKDGNCFVQTNRRPRAATQETL